MASTDLISIRETEEYLGSPASDKALVQALITRASTFIRHYTGHRWIKETYQEYLDGGHADLILARWPVDMDMGVTVQDTAVDPPKTVSPLAFVVYPQQARIRKVRGAWASGLRRWLVTYDAGIASNISEVPGDIKQATLDLVAALYGQAGSDPGLVSESIGDYSYRRTDPMTSESGGLPTSVVTILNLYREPGF